MGGAAMHLSFTLFADLQCRIGESPVYDERTDALFLVDILGRQIHRIQLPGGGVRSWAFETEVGSLGLAASGRLVVALRQEVILFNPQTGARQSVCPIEAGQPTRLNDGKVGPDGAFWVGSMDDRQHKEPIGALYRVDASGGIERKVDGLTISNGLAWTADGERMFHADFARAMDRPLEF
jgi:sugar lactone lactonase YvrE